MNVENFNSFVNDGFQFLGVTFYMYGKFICGYCLLLFREYL